MKITDHTAEYCFFEGTGYESHKYFGCHKYRDKDRGELHYVFRVWAPNSQNVELVGDSFGWESGIKMSKTEGGVWFADIKSEVPLEGTKYKYKISSDHGCHLKGDPYALYSEGGAGGASVIYESAFDWKDSEWLKRRYENKLSDPAYISSPMNVYELHLGSFSRNPDGSKMSYSELADRLPSYVKELGFTHIELMPLAEYPFDDSWGYQVCGYFAPTSRYGDPDGLRGLVDACHRAGIGVIMDWVPAHFPRDEWGLFEFDGSPLYEYEHEWQKSSPAWGTVFFDLGKGGVRSFLISNALYWIEEFHLDGLRVDAVASMLYRDYDRNGREWWPNVYGDNRNLEAVEFLRKLNSVLLLRHSDVLMIAEESTSWPQITAPVSSGGLGFSLKWNMGWANDFFEYISTDPIFRRYHHRALTFPVLYAWSENFLLPISHDEVVYGKASLASKIAEQGDEKLEILRAIWLYILTFPGKKLFFMGCEICQLSEWNFKDQLDWGLLNSYLHKAFFEYVAAANKLYLNTPALWEKDFDPSGFSWVNANMSDQNTIIYKRYGRDSVVLVAVNFSGLGQKIMLTGEDAVCYELSFVSSQYMIGIDSHLKPDNGRVEFVLPARCAVMLVPK